MIKKCIFKLFSQFLIIFPPYVHVLYFDKQDKNKLPSRQLKVNDSDKENKI